MAQKLEYKRDLSRSKNSNGREVIHSGHFMVSDFEAEAQDDEDELAVPVPDVDDGSKTVITTSKTVVAQGKALTLATHLGLAGQGISIETSLSKLFQCMSLAYRQKLTSPKWNRFKGIRLRWKDKIRLNNVIWRCWHMQFINKQKTLVCQFASPLDVDTHNKPEAVVLEGKYWKRKLKAVTAEYKKWRMYSHHQILGRPPKYDIFAEFDGQDLWPNSQENLMMVDEDYMGLMSDTLFSTITANQPYAFPDSREIARGANLADFIQPSLVQLQPNLEEFMDIEPLHDFICSKLTTVPEITPPPAEPTPIQTSYEEVKSNMSQIQPPYPPMQPYPPPYPSQNLWYLPEYNTAQQSLSQQTLPQQSLHLQQSYQQTPTAGQILPTANSDLGLTRADDVYAQPKTKAKWRNRANSNKKLATVANNPAAIGQTVTSQLPSSQIGSAQMPPSSSQTMMPLAPAQPMLPPSNIILPPEPQQGSALLAQLLTNNSSSTFNFISDEPSGVPSKIIGGLKEEMSYAPHSYNLCNASLPYKNENEFGKQAYQICQLNSTTPVGLPVQASGVSQMGVKQNAMSNMVCASSVNIGPDSPGHSDSIQGQDPLRLSPLSAGSPTSPTNSLTGRPNRAYREHRRVCHINAEQKRRYNIKNGFDTLHSLIPHLNQNPNAKMSKAAMLQKGAEYIRQLQNERTRLQKEMESLKQQIETLNTDICNCQSLLPATGAPLSKQRSSKMRDMYRKYVRSRTHDNWKFWILSLICEPLLESFNNNVATSTLDDLYRTTLQWVDQHCTLVDLRPVVLNALRLLCTSTEVLSEPNQLPVEARAAVDKAMKNTNC